MTPSDHELLQQYASDDSQAAFAELVRRHLDLVYSAARRQVRSPALSEEIAQAVFLDLARNSGRITPGTPLVAWLHVVTRRTSIDAIRRESRRRIREQTALEIAAMKSSASTWAAVEPLLDEAIEKLDEADRAAVLLRYFENKTLREVGTTLGVSDDTAQKRVSRALDQLRGVLAKSGVALTAAGFVSDLSARAILSAPPALGTMITSTVATSTGLLVHAAAETAQTAVMTSAKKFTIAALALTLTSGAIIQGRELLRQRDERTTLQAESSGLLAELARLRADADQVALQLKVDAPPAPPSPRRSDLELDAEIEAWLARVSRLKDLVQQRPAAAIPEMAMLTEKDWFDAARDAAFATAEDLRKSLAAVRNQAREKVTHPLRQALVRYLDANEARLPTDISQLASSAELPLTPEILARYEMLYSGPLNAASFNRWLIAEKSPIDEAFDTCAYVSFGKSGTVDFLEIRPADLQEALRAFAKANAGNLPSTRTQLLPFFQTALSPLTANHFLAKAESDFSPAELKKILHGH